MPRFAANLTMMFTELPFLSRFAAAAEADFPGGKYPGLFLFFLVPNRGHTVEENEKDCYQIIERLKTQKVSDETLQRIKTKVRASLIRRKLFTSIDDIDKVTADDVVRVAKQYLVPQTRTVAYTVQPAAPGKPESGKPESGKAEGPGQ